MGSSLSDGSELGTGPTRPAEQTENRPTSGSRPSILLDAIVAHDALRIAARSPNADYVALDARSEAFADQNDSKRELKRDRRRAGS